MNSKDHAVAASRPLLGRTWRPRYTTIGDSTGIDEVSSYLGVPKHSIYGWRKTEYGPPPVKIGKHLKWRPAAVVEWVRQQERRAG